MLLAEAQLDLIFLSAGYWLLVDLYSKAACHDRFLMEVAHVKLASNHAVTGKESVLCSVATLKMQFSEADAMGSR